MAVESPYWWDAQSRTAPRAAPLTSETQRADVAIVGAGYTGLSAARVLARTGARVVVLERERVGWGASSRNGGQILTGLKLDPVTLAARAGEAGLAELFAISIDAIAALEAVIAEEGIACDYARTGHVQAASRPSHFDDFRAEQTLLARVCRHRVELIPRERQRTEIGSDAYHGVMVDERSGALDPARYADGLAAAARRAGAVIAEGAGVERIVRDGRDWRVTLSNGATVDAGQVLLATNGYADAAAPWLRRRVVPIGSYVIVTEPLSASVAGTLLPNGRMAFDSRHFLHYFRLTPDRRLLFGGRAVFAAPTAGTARQSAEILAGDMRAVFPALASVRIDYAWHGTVGFTRDQLPHAGTTPDGLHYAAGYCGHGVAMATYLGALVARRIAGETIAHPLCDRAWPAIPLYDGRPWFLPLVGAYYRLKDWIS
ncbi:MAG: NAD(P)/FAD-dependent oxidoreductase [Vicinamibacterales bacterium]